MSCMTNQLVYILWRKLGLLLVGITCLQSAAMLLSGKANWLQWGLWKDMLYTIFAQGVANLPAMKVWGLKKWIARKHCVTQTV